MNNNITDEDNKGLSRREFLQQYVLNRALGRKDGFNPVNSAEVGNDAFEKIEELCYKEKFK